MLETTNMWEGKEERKKREINCKREKREIQLETQKACHTSPNDNKSKEEIVPL